VNRYIPGGWITRLAFPAALLLAACCGNGSGEMIDIGGHSLHLMRAGEGSPTVVIDVGIGARSEAWAAIRERISRETGVLTYDRAGYGRSDPGPLPRDAATAAAELHALLEAAAIPGPYLLVGRSLGALNIQLFADRYPEDVAGMVLLDPPPLGWLRGGTYPGLRGMAERMTAEWQSAADEGGAEADFYRTIASEYRQMLGASGEQAAAIDSFGEIPMVVIASGRPSPMFGEVAEEYQRYWIEQSRLLAGKSTRSRFMLIEESSQMLYDDAEDEVTDSIVSLLSEPVPSTGAIADRSITRW
jgi:pimeloyl-ACP methyl ester carboxylesterase